MLERLLVLCGLTLVLVLLGFAGADRLAKQLGLG